MSTLKPGACLTPTAEPQSDADLVVLARAGDDAAFGLLVRRHAQAAYAVARGVVGDPDLAEDVCQDALFRVWERLGDCRDPARFGPWLGQAVRRHALNALRGPRRADPAVLDTVPAPGRGPDAFAERAELRERLDRALRMLPEAQRVAVLLFDLEGWAHADIAGVLGTTEATSRQHLVLGRRKLRELLADQEATG